MEGFARFISVLFHPLLMATYLCLLFMYAFPIALEPVRQEVFNGFLMLIFLVTFVLPMINIAIFKFFGSISSFTMPNRRDRLIPFAFISILYVLITYLFYSKFNFTFTDNVLKFMVIMDLLVVAATVITFFYKISVHSIGVCGLIGILLPLNRVAEDGALFYPTIAIIVIAGMVMSARLYLQVHTPREVTWGGITGFSISYLSMMLFFFQ